MDAPVIPSDDYTQGQMMGMLCVIRLIRNAQETKTAIPASVFDNIEKIARESLSTYLDKPEEDVILMVNQLLNTL